MKGTFVVVGLTVACTVAQAQETLHHIGTHTGTINGGAFAATNDGFANGTTGEIFGSVNVTSNPEAYRPSHTGWSLFCISCANRPRPFAHAQSIYDILGGKGTYTHTRTYTYPSSAGSSLTVNATFALTPDTLTYQAVWSGSTVGVPLNVVDVQGYTQTLTPAGDGLIEVHGATNLVLSDNSLVPIMWSGMYNLGPGNNLTRTELSTIDLDRTSGDDFNFQVAGTSTLAVECPADFDGDGFITGVDYDLYVQAFETGDMNADFDGDGFLTGIDFDLYVASFEAGC